MDPQMQKMKKKPSKGFIIAIIVIIVVILGWAGLTRAGFIPNYWEIDFLCAGQDEPKPIFKNDRGKFEELMDIEKPVIYLYPEQKQDVTVQLDYQGKLIADYPAYDKKLGGWSVTAYPDGRLVSVADDKEYSYLFWEGESSRPIKWDLSTGFVVKGSQTREFLQDKLAQLGLTPKEYNEFIVYWYPKMKDNRFNLIHFAGEQYTATAPLTITPKPDSMLRVFMVFKPLNREIAIKPQEIQPFERHGFAVVEWGGTEVR